ncbi:hypothetical protein Trydic_g4474 [Trypoxylus dichotomus]
MNYLVKVIPLTKILRDYTINRQCNTKMKALLKESSIASLAKRIGQYEKYFISVTATVALNVESNLVEVDHLMEEELARYSKIHRKKRLVKVRQLQDLNFKNPL